MSTQVYWLALLSEQPWGFWNQSHGNLTNERGFEHEQFVRKEPLLEPVSKCHLCHHGLLAGKPLRTSWKDGEQIWLTFTKSAVCLPDSEHSLGFRVLGEAQMWNSSPYTLTFSDSPSVWLFPVRWLPDFLLHSRCRFPKEAIRNRAGDSLEILWGKII